MIRHRRHVLWQRWLAWLSRRGAHSGAFRATRTCLSALAAVPRMQLSAHHCLGQLHDCVGECREALACYERALRNGKPRDRSLYHHLGMVLLALGRFDDAEMRLRQSIAHKPRAWWSYKALGEIMLRRQRWPEAQLLFEQTLQLNDAEHWSYFHLFEARRMTLGWKPALSLWLDEVLAAPPLQALTMQLGTLWAEGDELSAEQVDKLRQVAERYLHCDEISYILAFTLGRQGDIEGASRGLRKHMRLAWERDYNHNYNHNYNIRVSSPASTKLPEFLIFGNSKSGSTALYQYLIDHPLICPALVKEVCYWDKYHDYGQDWYRSCFMPIPVAAPHITGEGSITSLWHAQAPRRVAEFRNDMKLLLIIRDPVARAYSDYQMRRRLGYDLEEWAALVEKVLHRFPHCPLEPDELPALAHHENVLVYSAVLPYLKRWRQHFSARQFLVLNSDDLAADTQRTLSTAYAFLGVPPHTVTSTARTNVGRYPAMAGEIEQRLRQWFQPHQDALANYLSAHMA